VAVTSTKRALPGAACRSGATCPTRTSAAHVKSQDRLACTGQPSNIEA
jgi:hypothetical protein